MPALKRQSETYIEPQIDARGISGVTVVGKEGQFPQTTPLPFGPESVELSRIMANVLSSLEQLETFKLMGNPFLALLGRTIESGEASFDYKRIPPTRRIPVNTRFFIRGRGKPMPYPLEDDE